MNKKIILFIIITYGLSILLASGFYLAGGQADFIGGQIFGVVYMFMPFIGTIIVQKLIYGEKIIKPLKMNFRINRWWVAAGLLPFLISGLTFVIGLLFPGVSFSPGMEGMLEVYSETMPREILAELEQMELSFTFLILGLIQSVFAAFTINNLFAFGEEIGWRGLMYCELKEMGFWKKSILIGLFWGLWHAPLIIMGHNYPNYPVIGVFMMVVFCVLYSPLFTFVRKVTGSVVGASILHGAVNASVGYSFMFLQGGNELLVGLMGLAGFIVLLLVNFVLYYFWYKRTDDLIENKQ